MTLFNLKAEDNNNNLVHVLLSIFFQVMNVTDHIFYHSFSKGTMAVVQLKEYRERIRAELDNVVDFWLRYSHDTVHG